MSTLNPSNPLNALDAKLLADQARENAKFTATQEWLRAASVTLTTAAKAGNYSAVLAYDDTVVNLVEIVKQLDTVLGYDVSVDSANSQLLVDWSSIQRKQAAPPSNSYSNQGYIPAS